MSLKSDMARDAYESFSSFSSGITSGISAINKIKENNKAKTQNLQQNKYQLEMSYKKAIDEKAQTLPASLDINSYYNEMENTGHDWLSGIQASGLYDEETLKWVSEEFLPSQQTRNTTIANGVADYALYSRSTQMASDQASIWASDTNMSYEDAVKNYTDYYNNCNLSAVPSEYGIVSPGVYAETIRSEKCVQAFKQYSASTDTGYGYSSAFSFEDAVEYAKEQTDYSPSKTNEIQLLQNCLTALSEVQADLKNTASGMYSNIMSAYGEYYFSDKVLSTTFDTTELYDSINSIPFEYAGDLIKLASQIESHNTEVNSNSAIALINQGYWSDEVLSMVSDEDTRASLIKNRVLSLAKSSGNGVFSDIASNIIYGDFGITVDAETRAEILNDYIQNLKNNMSSIEALDEVSVFFEQNPDVRTVLLALDGYYNSVTSTPFLSGSVIPTETIETPTAETATGTKETVTEPVIEHSADTSEEKVAPATEDSETVDVQTSNQEPTQGIATEEEPADGPKESSEIPTREEVADFLGLEITESGDVVSKEPTAGDTGTPTQTTLTNSGTNALSGNTESQIVDNANAVKIIEQFRKDGAPDEVLASLCNYYVQKEELTTATAETLCKSYGFADTESWDQIDRAMVDYFEDVDDISQGQRNTITNRVKQGVIDAFMRSGLTWKDFEPEIGQLIDVFTSEAVVKESIRQATQYVEFTRKSGSEIETLTTNGKKGEFYTNLINGRYDCLLDYDILNTISDFADYNEAKEYVATHLYSAGYTSYEDATDSDRDPSRMNELAINVMMGVWGLQNDAKEFYKSAIKGLQDEGIEVNLECCILDSSYGFIFADNNTLSKGSALCVDPKSMIKNDNGTISANWYVIYGSPVYSGTGTIKKITGFSVDSFKPINLAEWANVGTHIEVANSSKTQDVDNFTEALKEKKASGDLNWLQKTAYTGASLVGELLSTFAGNDQQRYEIQAESFETAYKTAYIRKQNLPLLYDKEKEADSTNSETAAETAQKNTESSDKEENATANETENKDNTTEELQSSRRLRISSHH